MAKPSYPATLDTGHALAPDTLCYLFNEGSGSTAHDSTGNANHGTITGATWGANGLDFGTAGDAVTFSQVTLFQTPFTLAFSEKNDAEDPKGMIIGKPGTDCMIFCSGNDKLPVRDAAGSNMHCTTLTQFTTRAIYHIVFGDDGVEGASGMNVKYYKNGVLSQTVVSGPARVNFAFTAVGDGYFDNSLSMVGEIDWLMIDARAWSGAEVASHAADPFQAFSGGGGATRRISACLVA